MFVENYHTFGRKHVNWDVVRAKYRPMITTATSDSQLYRVLVDMVEPLGDAHVCVQVPDNKSFCGKRSEACDDVSRRSSTTAVNTYLREDLGVSDIQSFADGKIAYADLPDERGYLRVTAFQDYGGGDRSPYPDGAAMSKALASVFTQARVRACRGLVIDVRWNDGGDDALTLQWPGGSPTPHTSSTPTLPASTRTTRRGSGRAGRSPSHPPTDCATPVRSDC
jgi:hypothetical protein